VDLGDIRARLFCPVLVNLVVGTSCAIAWKGLGTVDAVSELDIINRTVRLAQQVTVPACRSIRRKALLFSHSTHFAVFPWLDPCTVTGVTPSVCRPITLRTMNTCSTILQATCVTVIPSLNYPIEAWLPLIATGTLSPGCVRDAVCMIRRAGCRLD
jgi:hypothetical protein